MTNPVQPSSEKVQLQPISAKRRLPSPQREASLVHTVPAIKKATIEARPKIQILKLLFYPLMDEITPIELMHTNEGLIVIDNPHYQYRIYPTETQVKLLSGLPVGELLTVQELVKPIRCERVEGQKNFSFTLNLLSIFYTKNSYADALIKKISSSEELHKLLIAHAMTYAFAPFFCPFKSFLNPRYVESVNGIVNNMMKLNASPNGKLYLFNQPGFDIEKISKIAGMPSDRILTRSDQIENVKSLAQIEAEEAKNILDNSATGNVTSPFLRTIKHFKETYFPLLLIDTLSFKVGSFECDLKSEFSFFQPRFMWKLLERKLNPPYDDLKSFKENVERYFYPLHPFFETVTITDETSGLFKTDEMSLKISYNTTPLDSEFLTDLLSSDVPLLAPNDTASPPVEASIPLDASPADLLQLLSYQILFEETSQVTYNRILNDYSVTLKNGQTQRYSLKPCHFEALKGTLGPDAYLEAFIEPIVCKIEDVEFNFSLFSLFFSKDLTRYIKKENITLSFLVHASRYGYVMLSSYRNPDNSILLANYLSNLERLSSFFGFKKIPIEESFYRSHPGLENRFIPVAETTRFRNDFFYTQELIALERKRRVTPYLRAWDDLRKEYPEMQMLRDRLIVSKGLIYHAKRQPGVETIRDFIVKHIPSSFHKKNIRSLLANFIQEKGFLYFIQEQNESYAYRVIAENGAVFEFNLSKKIHTFIKGEDVHLNLLDLTSNIEVVYKLDGFVTRLRSSFLALFYRRDPYIEFQIQAIQTSSTSSQDYTAFLASAVDFALRPYDRVIYLNPEYIKVIETLYRNLKELKEGTEHASFPCPMERTESTFQTGAVTWSLQSTSSSTLTASSVYHQEINAIQQKQYITPHAKKIEKFLKCVQVITSTDTSMVFKYQGQTYEVAGEPIALHPIFKQINGELPQPAAPLAEPPKNVQEVAKIYHTETSEIPYAKVIESLLFPIASRIEKFTISEVDQKLSINAETPEGPVSLHLNVDQSFFLKGCLTQNNALSTDLIKPIDVIAHGKKFLGRTSIFALFYGDNDLTTTLKSVVKSCSYKDAFLANGITFALHPIINNGPTCNPNLIPLLETFHRHFVDINYLNELFPSSIHRHPITIGNTVWKFKSPVVSTHTYIYLASSEAKGCIEGAASFATDHIRLWQRFFQKVKLVSHTFDRVTVHNGKEHIHLKGTFLSETPQFKALLETTDAITPLPLEPLSLPSSENPPQPHINREAMRRIAEIIENYWFQNPVNYSRWIKLLQKSKAVFAFDSLPSELMEPLKGFKKEHTEEVLKYLGVGVDITGNLEKDIIEKAVPTLLRVKAAEFKLVKKTFGEERERKEIEFKPCYLVKPGPRFVHVIKVIARFDEFGLLSGFFMAEGNVESNISLDAFNKLVEEGKNKRAIVLQRATIKLTEEALKEPEISPTRNKREREEGEKKEDESDEKVAKGDPILPPVPVSRPNLKRPSTENTVKPKAPKESKFNDKGDIATDKPRALGKPQDGGIIAPPEMIDQPKAPDLQQALSLDDLFTALSANAGAQINHVVKISLNQLKAIFSEEPLAYEGLEFITKLENTPVPTTPCLVPKAKSYQWDFVLQAKRRENAGLGTILAPYMGLGKTWIYISKIILSLYEDTKGHHLVITPKPLRKTITEDAIVILNDARLNAFVHLKSMKWGNWCIDSIIKESNPREITFLLSLLGLFDEESFNKIMAGRGPITNTLVLTYVKGFHQYPSNLKRLYEHCKSIAPKSLPERGHFDEKGLERILKFSSSRIVKCEEGKDLVKQAKSDEAKIIIASYEQAEHLASDPACTPGCASMTFDEAQYIHNPEIKIAKAAETLLKALNPKAKMAVTGTPIENGIEDLFQLVGLMAPELKCPSILSTLHTLSSGASRFTKFKDREQALTHLIKFHGHMQAYLTRVSQNLVLILKKDDPRVKEAWGDGAKVEYARENISISALAEQKYREAHELFKTRKVDTLTGKKLDSNMAYYSRVASIMLDPELKAESLTKKDPAVQRLLKWIKAEPDMAKIDELIARSAILSSIVYSPKTLKAIDEKRVELIFVANIAVGKVIRKVLKRKFPESQGTESYLMYGDQKDEKKDKIIDSLKENGKSKFGILSIESGSTGFSIPDAYVTIMQTLSYNVATELQAIGRMDRATSKGEKYVVYPRFGIFSEEHIPVVQEIKKLTFKSFFSPAATQLERLQDIAQLNRHNIYQSYLNEKRDAQEALAEMQEIDAITESLLSAVDEEELQAFVKKLTPPLPIIAPPPARVSAVAKAALAPALRIKGNQLFKLPLPSTLSNEDKIRLAHYIDANRKALEGAIKELYSQFKDPSLRPLVRSSLPMPTKEAAKALQVLEYLICEAKQSVRSIEDIGVDQFRIEEQDYVLESKSHPERNKRVKVVSSQNGPFEILI